MTRTLPRAGYMRPCTRSVHGTRPCIGCTAVCTAVYPVSVYGPCTRPCSGYVRLCTRPFTGLEHGRDYSPCTRPCTVYTCIQPCLRPLCTVVQSRTDRVHIRARALHMVRLWPEHGRVHGRVLCVWPVYAAVHGVYGPCTRPYMTPNRFMARTR